jgi:hypothetical protein
MQQASFKSSMLSSATYDEETQELIVTFNNGGEYKYFDVPNHIWLDFKAQNENVGKWFTTNIKNKYRYEKV